MATTSYFQLGLQWKLGTKSKTSRFGNLYLGEKSLCQVGSVEDVASEEISAIKK